MNFSEFWTLYLSEHRNAKNRELHAIGTIIGTLGVVIGLFKASWICLLLSPVIAYGFAFSGHFLIEHNLPMSFSRPLLSFVGDFYMLYCMLTGKIEEELEKLEP
jgi:hypothetical protein